MRRYALYRVPILVSLCLTRMCFFVFPHRPNILGKSALHWAAAVNNVEATLVLLKNGANRDMQDNKVGSLFSSMILSLRSCAGENDVLKVKNPLHALFKSHEVSS